MISRGYARLAALLLCLLPGWALQAATLDGLQNGWPELGLKATLAAPAGAEVEQGADLQLRLSADAAADVAFALEDAEHKARLYVPNRPGGDEPLVPGTELLYPDLGFGETLYADVPVGRATLWVIASDKSILKSTADGARGGSVVDSADLARQIDEARHRSGAARVTAVRVPILVVSPTLKEYVSAQDFVSFYAVRTRSVSGADRGFRIGFKSNSAELDDWSRKQLEAVGEGMRDPQLAKYHFAIEGHTDDTGTSEYNLDLSLRRAQAVQDFLAAREHVHTARLTTHGFGKSKPVADGNDESSRAQNRRVVIRRLDAAAD